jgi:hypothetical protein
MTNVLQKLNKPFYVHIPIFLIQKIKIKRLYLLIEIETHNIVCTIKLVSDGFLIKITLEGFIS